MSQDPGYLRDRGNIRDRVRDNTGQVPGPRLPKGQKYIKTGTRTTLAMSQDHGYLRDRDRDRGTRPAMSQNPNCLRD